MFSERQTPDLMEAIACHLLPSQVRSLSQASKAIRATVAKTLTESLQKTCLDRAAQHYTRPVRFNHLVGVFDVYTRHGNSHMCIYAGPHTLLEDRFPYVHVDFNGLCYEFHSVNKPFLEDGRASKVLIRHVDALVHARAVVGMWVRDIKIKENEISFELVLERVSLASLTMSLACYLPAW
jgi:hypothetical protein